jgi:hypothetical protein
LKLDQKANQLAKTIIPKLCIARIGLLGRNGERTFECRSFDLETGGLIMDKKTIEPVTREVERTAKIEQDCAHRCLKLSNVIASATASRI